MSDNANEKEIIMQLFNDGKITEEQKDALLRAVTQESAQAEPHAVGRNDTPKADKRKVTFRVVEMYDPTAASRVSTAASEVPGVKKAIADVKGGKLDVYGDFDADEVVKAVSRAGCACKPVDVEFDDTDEKSDSADSSFPFEIGAHGTPFDEYVFGDDDNADKSERARDEADDHDEPRYGDSDKAAGAWAKFGEKMAKLGRSISEAAMKGINSFMSVEDDIADYFQTQFGNNVVVKSSPRKYDVPFDDMVVRVKIANVNNGVTFKDKTTNIPALLQKCAAVMSDASFEALNSLLERKFVGKYKYVGCDGDMFKLYVGPNEDA